MKKALSDRQRNRIKERFFADDNTAKYFCYDGAPIDRQELTEFEKIFWDHSGNFVNKWHHYLPIYDRHLQSFRGYPVKVLEIGVFGGGSLQLWREFFGPDATIFGVDINEKCRRFDGQGGYVRIGSQTDVEFLQSVVEEMGGVDIVIDDGSHVTEHMRTTFEALFPILPDGSVYIVEDVHACYWLSYLGGYKSKRSFIEYAKNIIDDMHHWYHHKGQKVGAAKNKVSGIHFYDSMIVFEKKHIEPPKYSFVGREA